MKDLLDRLGDKVLIGDSCWIWTGAKAKGYGRIRLPGSRQVDSQVQVHRVMYELLVGPIPDGLDLDHVCEVRACCRPDHLEPVTRRENISRALPGLRGALQRAQTHCKSGHPFDEQNTLIRKNGSRRCRACARRWHAEAQRRSRAAA